MSYQAANTTTPAIMHALLSDYPLARYSVAGANGLPSWAVIGVVTYLPDLIVDAIFRAVS